MALSPNLWVVKLSKKVLLSLSAPHSMLLVPTMPLWHFTPRLGCVRRDTAVSDVRCQSDIWSDFSTTQGPRQGSLCMVLCHYWKRKYGQPSKILRNVWKNCPAWVRLYSWVQPDRLFWRIFQGLQSWMYISTFCIEQIWNFREYLAIKSLSECFSTFSMDQVSIPHCLRIKVGCLSLAHKPTTSRSRVRHEKEIEHICIKCIWAKYISSNKHIILIVCLFIIRCHLGQSR